MASRHPNLQLSALPSLRCLSLVAATPLHVVTGAGNTDAALNCLRRRPAAAHRRSRSPLALAASYSLVTGGPPGSGDGSSGGGGPVRLIVYSREGCHLCDGLKEKLEALLERAAFLPSALRCGRPCCDDGRAVEHRNAHCPAWRPASSRRRAQAAKQRCLSLRWLLALRQSMAALRNMLGVPSFLQPEAALSWRCGTSPAGRSRRPPTR